MLDMHYYILLNVSRALLLVFAMQRPICRRTSMENNFFAVKIILFNFEIYIWDRMEIVLLFQIWDRMKIILLFKI